VSKLARAAVRGVGSSKPQDFGNNLWSLSTLGWYDSAVYDELLWGLSRSPEQPMPLALSSAIYSCALAFHSGAAVDALARMVSKQNLSGWKGRM